MSPRRLFLLQCVALCAFVCVSPNDGRLYTCVSVNMAEYVPPTELCVRAGLRGQDIGASHECTGAAGWF